MVMSNFGRRSCSRSWPRCPGSIRRSNLFVVHVAEVAVDVAVGVRRLRQVQAGIVVADAVPLQAQGRVHGVELADMVDLAHVAGIVVRGRDAAEGPVAAPAIAGMGGHDRAVGRSQAADHDDGAGLEGRIKCRRRSGIWRGKRPFPAGRRGR